MFALPLITPAQDFSRFLPNASSLDTTDLSQPSDGPLNPSAQRRQNASAHPTSTIAALKADESLIQQHKVGIARFGATWIKPPGVSKTLQAETEERQEREEQEIMARREQMMLDMQAQQEAEEARQRAAAGEAVDEQADDSVRDLDDDIPDGSMGMDGDLSAEEEGGGLTEDDSMSEDEQTTEADVTFNDGSLIEGSMLQTGAMQEGDEENAAVQREVHEQERYAALAEAELIGVPQDELDLGMEGNLDDSVPEAGSYQHTDTELDDDDDSDDDDDASFSAIPQQRQPGAGGIFNTRRSLGARASGGSGASRASLGSRDASSLLDSSFVTSSPVMGRSRGGNNRGGWGR